jgi:DNA-binding transcriptional regulator YhcF (GntR family)
MMDREWNDSQPIYRQLRDRVVAMILDGVLKEGDPLPSVRTVAAEYRVNPLTVLKGYQQLVDEQLVESKRGRGMFINAGARNRMLLPADRLPHFQVDIHASNSGRVYGDRRFVLSALSVASARNRSVPLHCETCPHPRGTIAHPVARRGRRERSTMEGAGQRSGNARIKTAVYGRYGTPEEMKSQSVPATNHDAKPQDS